MLSCTRQIHKRPNLDIYFVCLFASIKILTSRFPSALKCSRNSPEPVLNLTFVAKREVL